METRLKCCRLLRVPIRQIDRDTLFVFQRFLTITPMRTSRSRWNTSAVNQAKLSGKRTLMTRRSISFERLQRDGFDVGPHEAVLVLDLQVPPKWVVEPLVHRVVRIESLDLVPLFRDVAERVFGGDWSPIADDLSRAIRSDSADHIGYIAFDDNVPAAIGRLYTRPKSMFGGLYGGGTLSAHRKRGLYRDLVANRARDAAKFGARYLLVDALPTSRPILESLGFRYLTGTWPCTLRQPVPTSSSRSP